MPRITKTGPNGPVTLAARVWDLIADAAKEVGIDPDRVVVTQGSWNHGSLSGSTHDGGGAFDLRVWNLPQDKIEPFVVALRRRNVCAWHRDRKHGGFDPHIHGIVRDAEALSRGAAWQVAEYDAGRNGLADGGADYHLRPVQRHWPFPAPPKPKPTKGKTTVTWPRGTSARRAPSKDGKVAFRREKGFSFSYVAVVRNAEGVWLKTRFGNFYNARHTARGA